MSRRNRIIAELVILGSSAFCYMQLVDISVEAWAYGMAIGLLGLFYGWLD